MAKIYKSICNEADVLFNQITNLVEKQISYKLEMEKLMNKGFVKIAKARYIMGSTCVTKMQLPSENSNPIQPIATVCRKEKNNHWVFHIRRTDTIKNFKENRTKILDESENKDNLIVIDRESNLTLSNKASHYSEEDFKNILQNNPKALKITKKAFHVDDNNYEECKEELLDEFSNRGSNESLYSFTDPMKLFGILVPNTLKEAQDDFKNVVNFLGKCATLQSELKENLRRYNHLNRVKALMEIAADETKLNISETKDYWTVPSIKVVGNPHSDKKDKAEDESVNETTHT